MPAFPSDLRRPGLIGLAALLFQTAPLAGQATPPAPTPPAAPPAVAPAAAPQASLQRILSSEISISRTEAELELGLADGRSLELALRNGRIEVDGDEIGTYRRGDALDRSWRELLSRAMDAHSDELPALLAAWTSPDASGATLDSTLDAALAGTGLTGGVTGRLDELQDDISSQVDRIRSEVEREVRRELESKLRSELRQEMGFNGRGAAWTRPFRNIMKGVGNIIGTLALYAVLVGLGFAAVFFGRKYLEGVSDTARYATLRSWAVGLAASFLVVPVFVLGVIVLAVSIVGIPALLAWVPLFPLAFVLALVFGYLAVGHAAGEALAERRFYGGEWFKHANSYYYILTGMALLQGLHLAAHVVEMAGPWLRIIYGLLVFLTIALTWLVLTIGLGAVLISRGGTRPVAAPVAAGADVGSEFAEESRV
ncbi:MAG: hypothetical protein HY561_09510 [Gemmatimonadetes bacterium]|nr:hypothetical protein [Gemmatimonadota bacterium]